MSLRSPLAAAGVAALLCLGLAAPAFSDNGKTKTDKKAKPAAAAVDFVKQVKPILEKGCVKCHGPKQAKGDYRLDSKDAAMRPGEHLSESGKSPIVAGKSAESMIYVFASAKAPDRSKGIQPMPPKKERTRLTDEEVALIGKWIDEGASWPDGVTLDAPR